MLALELVALGVLCTICGLLFVAAMREGTRAEAEQSDES